MTSNLETPAVLDGTAPLATATADTADGLFTVRIYAGMPSKVDTWIAVVTNLDGAGYGQPYATTLPDSETAQQHADHQAAGWLRARGAAR